MFTVLVLAPVLEGGLILLTLIFLAVIVTILVIVFRS
jgi:hypothetical protein